MIIFLNGASSSGKTSIARALQRLSQKPLLTLGVDTFLAMMPSELWGNHEKAQQGFQFILEEDEEGPKTRIEAGPFGAKIFELMPEAMALIVNKGFDMIIDEVLFGDKGLLRYVEFFKSHLVYFIGIHCPLAEIQRRERIRGDRQLGLGRVQFDSVHGSTRYYDLELDTSKKTPDECAAEILQYIEKTPEPSGFKELFNIFYGENREGQKHGACC